MHMTSQKGAHMCWGSNEALPRGPSPSMQPAGPTPAYAIPHWARSRFEIWNRPQTVFACPLNPSYCYSVKQRMEKGWGISLDTLVSVVQTHSSQSIGFKTLQRICRYVSKLEIFFHNSKNTKDLNFNSNILPLEQGFFNSWAEGFPFFILL